MFIWLGFKIVAVRTDKRAACEMLVGVEYQNDLDSNDMQVGLDQKTRNVLTKKNVFSLYSFSILVFFFPH